ncbi:glycosyltransferase family 4 protein [Rhodohalobacter sp. 614A]|uniref:glycosyltransferase family 4 protein n=1 Tax=Rhodohalobacter sp. 614A TaxID=2908649 RepID=UPI001F2460DF|nr:glycosyltransferase family 4 protein [Rhodohalobacter sp. 614A]
MKILQVHNKYKITGGEWTVLNQEYDLLRRDHEVDQLIVDNNEILNSTLSKLKLIFSTHYNSSSKELLKAKLHESKPDVMHVHNFFPLLTPSIFEAAREAGVPSVLTLHNYRLIHPNGLMYHQGNIDTRSVSGSAYQCVTDGVYRDSILQTAVSAHMIEYHRKHKTWDRLPSAFIALSEFSKQKFIEGGLPGDRIIVKPNFMEDPAGSHPGLLSKPKKKHQFIYVGRMSHEKGVQDLIDCWMKYKIKAKLILAGDGPLKSKLEKKSKDNSQIMWLGEVSNEEILQKLAESSALLFPTKWYEGLPMILIEAMSVGCPILTSKIGNPQDLVDHNENGLHFEPGNVDELYERIQFFEQNEKLRMKMGEKAREKYVKYFTPESNYRQLMDVYEIAEQLEQQLAGSQETVLAK